MGSFSGTLAEATFNAINSAQTVDCGTTNVAVRSVILCVDSNYGATFTGLSELAFEATNSTGPPPNSTSFVASTNLVTAGNTVTLSWQVVGLVTNLAIDNGVGSVLIDTVSQRELGRRYAAKMLMINAVAAAPPPLAFAINLTQFQLSWPATHTG